jgi:ABC-type Fe3+/spermidine/putrescine transport system ATPase subunit
MQPAGTQPVGMPNETPLPGGAAVDLREVTRTFGEVTAVDAVTLAVRGGELFSLVGPSGCGKTTLLRLIAGLEWASAGEVWIGGRDLTRVPAHRRPVNLVFQHYALFPHLTVADNVAFGLRYLVGAARPGSAAAARVAAALDLVRLRGLDRRYPDQLSGGQRQRVALARALVLAPQVLLLDEPLAALDQELRQAMQLELKRLQRKVGITFLLVTHDQQEALALSDRVAVMSEGRIEQVGTPLEVFERPETAFVAAFTGAANLWNAEVLGPAGGPGEPRLRLRLAAVGIDIEVVAPAPAAAPDLAVRAVSERAAVDLSARAVSERAPPAPPAAPPIDTRPGAAVLVAVRPEKLTLRVVPPVAGSAARSGLPPLPPGIEAPLAMLPVTVEERVYQGARTVFLVRDAAGERRVVHQSNATAPPAAGEVEAGLTPGNPALLCWDPRHTVLLRR